MNMHILAHLGEISLQTDVFGPGCHFPAHGRGLCSNGFHLLLHLLPDSRDAHEGRGTHLLQGVHQRALMGEGSCSYHLKTFVLYTKPCAGCSSRGSKKRAGKIEICSHNMRRRSHKETAWKCLKTNKGVFSVCVTCWCRSALRKSL